MSNLDSYGLFVMHGKDGKDILQEDILRPGFVYRLDIFYFYSAISEPLSYWNEQIADCFANIIREERRLLLLSLR